MKSNKTIVNHLTGRLCNDEVFYGKKAKGKYYANITGYYNENYYDITLKEYINTERCVELAHTTDVPESIVKIIKEIEPKIKVIWVQKVTTEKQIIT